MPARIALSSYADEAITVDDGFVVARKLHRAGRVVEVLLLASRIDLRGDALAMFERLPLRPVEVTGSAELKAESSRGLANCDLMVDAILGTGFRAASHGALCRSDLSDESQR